MSIVVGQVTSCEAVVGKDKLKVVEVDVGGAADGPVVVVTNAPNVRLESRVAVALVGAVVGDVTVTKSKMPADLALGSSPPTTKPRGGGGGGYEGGEGGAAPPTEAEPSAKELKRLEKERKKAALADKRAVRKAAKGGAGDDAAVDDADAVGGAEDGDEA